MRKWYFKVNGKELNFPIEAGKIHTALHILGENERVRQAVKDYKLKIELIGYSKTYTKYRK